MAIRNQRKAYGVFFRSDLRMRVGRISSASSFGHAVPEIAADWHPDTGSKRRLQIQRVWVWSPEKSSYIPPANGCAYEARKYEPNNKGGMSRVRRSFKTVDEARHWQRHVAPYPKVGKPGVVIAPDANGPTFGSVYEEFRTRKIAKLAPGTQQNYERYIELHFQSLMALPINSITPSVVDTWLQERIAQIPSSSKSRSRTSFKHELSVLRSVLGYYAEYHEDPDFRDPLKKRHAEAARVKKAAPRQVSVTVEEFWRFHAALSNMKHAALIADMAVVQFFQALRVSEVVALYAQDLNLNIREPHLSTLRACRHVQYSRNSSEPSQLVEGFKNASGGTDSVRELWMFPESYAVLNKRADLVSRGLLFPAATEEGFFTYRQVQKAYNTAFERAGLPYRSTHVLRHGGCQAAYNATGDLALAQQLLGNSDLQSTLVYAKREKAALRDFVKSRWEMGQNSTTQGFVPHEEPPKLDANGRKRSPGSKKPAV